MDGRALTQKIRDFDQDVVPPLERTARETAIIDRVRALCVEHDLDVKSVGTILAVVGNGLQDHVSAPPAVDAFIVDLTVAGAWLAE